MTGTTANGRPFDLEAASAAASAEAEGQPFAFTWAGEAYEVPPATAWPIAALRKLSEGDLDAALGELLGAEALDRLAAAGLKLGDLNVLFDEIAKRSGLGDLKNSPRRAPPAGRQKSRR